MKWTRIKVGTLLAKRQTSINPGKYPSETFTLYSIPAFDRRTPDVVKGSDIGSSKQILRSGDVLLSKIVPHIRRCWVVGEDSLPHTKVGSGEWMIFRSNDIEPNYLSRVLVSDEFHNAFMRTVAGVGGSLLRARPSAVAELEIPIPPTLDEQKRIAAVLDKADALRRQRQESLQLTEDLLQSVFIDMFVLNSEAKKWTPRTVEWMALDRKGSIRSGPFGSQLLHSEFVDSGVAVLGIDNAVKNRFQWAKPRFITHEKYKALKRYKVFPGDVLITIMGTNGRCAVVPTDVPEAINTKHLCCITLDRKKCLPEFLHAAFLNHPEILKQLGVRAKGAVMPGLNMGIIKGLEIPMPPIELQQKFLQIYRNQTRILQDQETNSLICDELFTSLQQRAFRGELHLSRIVIKEQVDEPHAEAEDITGLVSLANSKPPEKQRLSKGLRPTPTVNRALKKLDAAVAKGEPVPWTPDYVRYRIIPALEESFTADQVVEQAESIFETIDYDDLRRLLYSLLGKDEEPSIKQRFDLQFAENLDGVLAPIGIRAMTFDRLP